MEILREFATRAEELRVLHIIVRQEGREVARQDWDDEIRRNQYSASKSFTSAAVGFAVQEGLIDTDEKVVDAFAGELPREVSGPLSRLTVHHLLTMQLGQDKPYLMGGQRRTLEETDWVRYALSRPFAAEPGTRFQYSNVGPYLAGILVQRRAGCSLVNYLTPRLFAPLGIPRTIWEEDLQGNTFGAGGLFLSVSEIALFAQLYLDEGKINGKRILDAEWVKRTRQKHADIGETGEKGYGYLFWWEKDAYRLDGKYGQFGVVIPEKNAVVAINAENHTDQNEILRWMRRTVLPRL